MSAFLVTDHHIDFMLSFMTTDLYGSVYVPSRKARVSLKYSETIFHKGEAVSTLDYIGQILINENYRSLAHRYGDNDEPHAYTFRDHPGANVGELLARCVQVLKACDCYDYQACESDDYEETDAARIVRDIRSAAISKLPGYDRALWGAPERPARGPISLAAMAAGRA